MRIPSAVSWLKAGLLAIAFTETANALLLKDKMQQHALSQTYTDSDVDHVLAHLKNQVIQLA